MVVVIALIISLAIILLGAEVFTNGIEWLGKKLQLSEGAVGSVLAAVGTALPETMIPIIAILFEKGEAGHEIGIGAILGAPFMLATLALFISGVAVIVFKNKRHNYPKMKVDITVMSRDLSFFLGVYTVAILAAFLQAHYLKTIVSLGLVLAYGIYVYFTITKENDLPDNTEEHINRLFFARKTDEPALNIIIIQVLIALGLIVLGAKVFVNNIEIVAEWLSIPPFVLALIIAPIATELPEKFNSVIWISKGKDTLALGNITGAMVFQSSLIPALGIALTEWVLTTGAIISAVLALISALIILLQLKIKKYLTPYALMVGGVFYLIFIILVLLRVIN